MSKKISLFLLLMLASLMSFSQNEWKLYKSISGVNIYTKDADCYFRDGSNMNQTVILFKIENTTNKNIEINWTLRVWYNNKEMINNGSAEQRNYSFIVDANKSIEGDCSQISNTKTLYLYKKFIDFKQSAVLTRFELENLTVTPYKNK